MKPVAILAVLFFLSGCGGGDGAPTMPVLRPPVTPEPQPPPTDPPAPTIDVTKATCSDMRTLADALSYLYRGATQLDADNDGKPCEEKFSQ